MHFQLQRLRFHHSTTTSRRRCTIIIVILLCNSLISAIFAQDFLSFLQPFIQQGGGGQGAPQKPPQPPPPSPNQQQQGFGGIEHFISAFKGVKGNGQAGGGGGDRFGQFANAAQGILSAFSNSDGGGGAAVPAASGGASSAAGGGGFGEYLNLGQNFGLGSALDSPSPSAPRVVAKRQAPPPPLPNFFDLFKGIGRKRVQQDSRMGGRQSAPPLSRQHHYRVQSNSPIVRLTDNFGRNFFGMLDEIYEYAQKVPDSGGGPPAPRTTPAPPTLPTLPSLQELFPWLPTLPTLAPPPTTPEITTTTLPEQGNSENGVISQNAILGEQQQDVATDFLDANELMRKFLKVMSKDASRPLKPSPPHNDGTEAGRNRPLMDQLFESDILLTSRQMKAIVLAEAERKKGGGGRRRKRKVITGGAYRWPKNAPVSYSFRESDEKWRTLIRTGLRLWELETCIRFRENGIGKDRVEFIRGGGCYSSVGRTGGTQRVSIGYGCDDKGIVSHEVGHALGFWHEQSRPDRDTYIHLDEKYILGGTDGNFAKRSDLETDGMGLPYDLGSVMHYGPNAFTIDWDHNTIITKDKKYQHSIGQRAGPSFIDVKQINRLYCHNTCQGTTVACANGGYADPNNCLRCKCPSGLGGASCTDVEPSDSNILATGIWQHLTHKGKKRCVWRIKSDKMSRVRFILDSVDYQCETTCHAFVEIKHNSDFQQNGFRSCCNEKNVEVLSDQSEILLISDPTSLSGDGSFALRYIADAGHGAPIPKPPPPIWVPGKENRPFRGVINKGGVIEKFILNAIPRVRDPDRPVESVMSILTDYFATSLLGVSKKKK